MEELENTIKSAVTRAFPGMQVQFDPYPGYGKLHGSLIWDGFQEHSQMERQRLVWDVLKTALTDDQKYAKGFLLTVTPAEMNAMEEVAA